MVGAEGRRRDAGGKTPEAEGRGGRTGGRAAPGRGRGAPEQPWVSLVRPWRECGATSYDTHGGATLPATHAATASIKSTSCNAAKT